VHRSHRAAIIFCFYGVSKLSPPNEEEEEEEPTRCYLVFYHTYEKLNMCRAALSPS
jgi:hypothetical protein